MLAHTDHADRKFGQLCTQHWHWMLDTLRQLEELLALLPDVVQPRASFGEARGGTMVGSPAPGRVGVMAVMDRRATDWIGDDEAVPDVGGDLEAWLRLLAEEVPTVRLPFSAAAFVVDSRGVVAPAAAAARWRISWTVTLRLLYQHRRLLATSTWVADFAADIAEFHRVLARVTGAGKWPQSIGKCPNCRRSLYTTIGADVVNCRRCGSSWSGVHYLRLRLMLEREAAQ